MDKILDISGYTEQICLESLDVIADMTDMTDIYMDISMDISGYDDWIYQDILNGYVRISLLILRI